MVQCSIHPNRKCEFYCEDCQTEVCNICKKKDHKNHNLSRLKKKSSKKEEKCQKHNRIVIKLGDSTKGCLVCLYQQFKDFSFLKEVSLPKKTQLSWLQECLNKEESKTENDVYTHQFELVRFQSMIDELITEDEEVTKENIQAWVKTNLDGISVQEHVKKGLEDTLVPLTDPEVCGKVNFNLSEAFENKITAALSKIMSSIPDDNVLDGPKYIFDSTDVYARTLKHTFPQTISKILDKTFQNQLKNFISPPPGTPKLKFKIYQIEDFQAQLFNLKNPIKT
ncbi:unnamed protein product [Moneuplotes crassus]|uniref:B box-type domain-containing protein n=1 Tax=Euplotes crassus TaxID=5936 RepID=A0AAD2CYH0_EUPCR|nr:unnamed protein product [Moneuplotes crassus]